jgi:hypothetical protein
MTEEALGRVLRAQLGTSVGNGEEGLPADVRIVAVRRTWQGVFEFKLESGSYEGPMEGERIPWLQGRFLT